jgi:hypothetical protein
MNGLILMLVQLKQLIGLLVDELNDLGLSPETLRQDISRDEEEKPSHVEIPDHHLTLAKRPEEETVSSPVKSAPKENTVPPRIYSRILYEVTSESGKSFPQLRVWPTTTTLSEAASLRSETRAANDERNSTESGANGVDELVPSIVYPISALHPRIEEADTTDTETIGYVLFQI